MDFSFGIEEEYFLVDADTKRLTGGAPDAFFAAVKKAAGERVAREFLRCQVEVITPPHTDFDAARRELRELRHIVAATAATRDLAIIASGTHPTARWGKQEQTDGDRYDAVMRDLQMIGQRDLLCGMHVHVELPDPNRRVEVMYRMLPYLPLFIALATSSPFWQGRRTGLMGYRLAAYDELPRTGMPDLFRTQSEFDAYIAALTRAGVIENSSFVWWVIRPSLRHPTLELRAPDSCTLIEDSIALAGLYRVLVRHLYVNPAVNAELDVVGRAIAVENKWRAQRYGVHGSFVTPDGATSVAAMIDQLIVQTAASAQALECEAELERCRAIATSGTSADTQLAVFEAHRNDESGALQAVTDWLAAATLQ